MIKGLEHPSYEKGLTELDLALRRLLGDLIDAFHYL